MFLPAVSLLFSTVLAGNPTSGTPVDIYAFLTSESQSMAVEFTVNGVSQCRIDTGYSPVHFKRPACTFDLPAGDVEIAVVGRVSGRDWQTETGEVTTVSVERRRSVLDIASATAPLAQRSADYGERFTTYIAEVEAFASRHLPKSESYSTGLSANEPVNQDMIAAAEERLGYRLPGDYVALMRKVGPVSIEDSAFTAPEDLRNTYDAMVQEGGAPEEILSAELEKKTVELFRSTTLLFTKEEDGLNGLLYRPDGESACGGRAAFYWVHQDSINRPKILRSESGTCADFAESVYFLLDFYVTERIVDRLPEHFMLVDTTTGRQSLNLSIDIWNENAPDIRMAMRSRGPDSNRPPFNNTHTCRLPVF